MKSLKSIARGAGLAAILAVPCASLAAPPDWAPAHGWRKKNDPSYAGHSGREWDYDYGVRAGSCDRGRIGQVLGGVVGGVAGGAIGAEVAKGSRPARRGDRRWHGRSVPPSARRSGGAWTRPTARASDTRWSWPTMARASSWTNPNTRMTYQLTPARRRSGRRRLPSFPPDRARLVWPERRPHRRLHGRHRRLAARDDRAQPTLDTTGRIVDAPPGAC